MAKRKLKDSIISTLDTLKAPIIWSGIAGLWYFGAVPFYQAVGSVVSTLLAGTVSIGLIERARLPSQYRRTLAIQYKDTVFSPIQEDISNTKSVEAESEQHNEEQPTASKVLSDSVLNKGRVTNELPPVLTLQLSNALTVNEVQHSPLSLVYEPVVIFRSASTSAALSTETAPVVIPDPRVLPQPSVLELIQDPSPETSDSNMSPRNSSTKRKERSVGIAEENILPEGTKRFRSCGV